MANGIDSYAPIDKFRAVPLGAFQAKPGVPGGSVTTTDKSFRIERDGLVLSGNTKTTVRTVDVGTGGVSAERLKEIEDGVKKAAALPLDQQAAALDKLIKKD